MSTTTILSTTQTTTTTTSTTTTTRSTTTTTTARASQPPPQARIQLSKSKNSSSISVDEHFPLLNRQLQIDNVVCAYHLPLHIDLHKIANGTIDCIYDRNRNVLKKQLRKPECYVKIFNSGKVWIVGTKSEEDARRAARIIARLIQRLLGITDQRLCLRGYRVANILATCRLPFGIKITELAKHYPRESYFEQELTTGVVWQCKEPKATVRIFTTGSIGVMGATSEDDVLTILYRLVPILYDFRCYQAQMTSEPTLVNRKRGLPMLTGVDDCRDSSEDDDECFFALKRRALTSQNDDHSFLLPDRCRDDRAISISDGDGDGDDDCFFSLKQRRPIDLRTTADNFLLCGRQTVSSNACDNVNEAEADDENVNENDRDDDDLFFVFDDEDDLDYLPFGEFAPTRRKSSAGGRGVMRSP